MRAGRAGAERSAPMRAGAERSAPNAVCHQHASEARVRMDRAVQSDTQVALVVKEEYAIQNPRVAHGEGEGGRAIPSETWRYTDRPRGQRRTCHLEQQHMGFGGVAEQPASTLLVTRRFPSSAAQQICMPPGSPARLSILRTYCPVLVSVPQTSCPSAHVSARPFHNPTPYSALPPTFHTHIPHFTFPPHTLSTALMVCSSTTSSDCGTTCCLDMSAASTQTGVQSVTVE